VQVFSFDLLVNAVVAGVWGFYAAISLGFHDLRLVEVANILIRLRHRGACAAYMMNTAVGLDPVLTGLLFTPVFYALGVAVYRIYYASFERKGEQSLRGLVFFFGILFIIEVSLVLTYGVDYRLVEAPYIGRSLLIGPIGIALRLLVPSVVGRC
jgi:branched-chain amino acid transport system permease protein